MLRAERPVGHPVPCPKLDRGRGGYSRGMCAVGFSPRLPLANPLGHGVLGTRASRPHGRGAPGRKCGRDASLLPGHAAPGQVDSRLRGNDEGERGCLCGRDTSIPRTPCPRKQIHGVKSDKRPLEPSPYRGTMPSAWGKYLNPRSPPSISRSYQQRPCLFLMMDNPRPCRRHDGRPASEARRRPKNEGRAGRNGRGPAAGARVSADRQSPPGPRAVQADSCHNRGEDGK